MTGSAGRCWLRARARGRRCCCHQLAPPFGGGGCGLRSSSVGGCCCCFAFSYRCCYDGGSTGGAMAAAAAAAPGASAAAVHGVGRTKQGWRLRHAGPVCTWGACAEASRQHAPASPAGHCLATQAPARTGASPERLQAGWRAAGGCDGTSPPRLTAPVRAPFARAPAAAGAAGWSAAARRGCARRDKARGRGGGWGLGAAASFARAAWDRRLPVVRRTGFAAAQLRAADWRRGVAPRVLCLTTLK